MRKAFSHLVISDRVLDQLGPAINAGHSMFVYGPPGNGKTVISQAIHNLLEGELFIPHALEVEGSIIRFFDPVNHEPVAEADAMTVWISAATTIAAGSGAAVRWSWSAASCRWTARAELQPDDGFYRAPVQAVANGGVLVIDDFGRQTCSPRELLNRWIVPLESRVDFLTLQTGQKFDLPFMTLVVFATNIKPQDLVDEAFLRRIQYKIFAESPTKAEFLQIFENCCRDKDIEYRPGRDRGPAGDLLPAAADPAARLPAARPGQPGDLACANTSASRGADARGARSGLCQLLRRRPGGAAVVRVKPWVCVIRCSSVSRCVAGHHGGRARSRRQRPPLSVRITSPLGVPVSRRDPDRRPGAIRATAAAGAGPVLRRSEAARCREQARPTRSSGSTTTHSSEARSPSKRSMRSGTRRATRSCSSRSR